MPFRTPIHELSFVAIDLETTGLVPGFDAITEIGAARFRLESSGKAIAGDTFEELVNPGRPISAKVTKITGIDDAMVADAPSISEVLPKLMDFFAAEPATVLVAHNARFDIGFLAANLKDAGLEDTLPPAICTVQIAKKTLPDAPRYGLEALMEWLGERAERSGPSVHHRALPDALHARNLLSRCVSRAQAKRLSDLGAKVAVIREEAPTSPDTIPAHMEPLEDAIAQGLAVDLNYQGGSKGRRRRPVQPLALFIQNATLYLRATCLLDAQDKSFRADRIVAVHSHEDDPCCS